MMILKKKGIAALESRIPPAKSEVTLSNDDRERRDAKALGALRTIQYGGWRRFGLSLEHLLALARDDSTRLASSGWAPDCAREFEIQILERDGSIEFNAAERLRKDLAAPLPHVIEFDEPAALEFARRQCPLGPLPIEMELQLRESHLRAMRHRDQTQTPGPNGTEEGISNDLATALGFDTPSQKIANLKAKIAARAREAEQ